jgi:hypothetical protein
VKNLFKITLIIPVIWLLGIPIVFGKATSLPPLPAHASISGGYVRIVSTAVNTRFNGMQFKFDYAIPLTKVNRTDAFYFSVPFHYRHYQNPVHFVDLGGAVRYYFSRTESFTPYLSYGLSFDQKYGDKINFGIRHNAIIGAQISKKSLQYYFQTGYHWSFYTGWAGSAKFELQEIAVSFGIRFEIAGCDCPH